MKMALGTSCAASRSALPEPDAGALRAAKRVALPAAPIGQGAGGTGAGRPIGRTLYMWADLGLDLAEGVRVQPAT